MPVSGDTRASPLVRERFRFRKYAKRAGLVVAALIALDVIATTATLALGLEIFKK